MLPQLAHALETAEEKLDFAKNRKVVLLGQKTVGSARSNDDLLACHVIWYVEQVAEAEQERHTSNWNKGGRSDVMKLSDYFDRKVSWWARMSLVTACFTLCLQERSMAEELKAQRAQSVVLLPRVGAEEGVKSALFAAGAVVERSMLYHHSLS
jgi:hypothetical protein